MIKLKHRSCLFYPYWLWNQQSPCILCTGIFARNYEKIINIFAYGIRYGEVATMNRITLKILAKLSAILFILGLVFFVIGCCIGNTVGLLVLAAGLLIWFGIIIMIALFSKCPYCGGFLKVGYHNLYCPHCGNYVNWVDYTKIFQLNFTPEIAALGFYICCCSCCGAKEPRTRSGRTLFRTIIRLDAFSSKNRRRADDKHPLCSKQQKRQPVIKPFGMLCCLALRSIFAFFCFQQAEFLRLRIVWAGCLQIRPVLRGPGRRVCRQPVSFANQRIITVFPEFQLPKL